MYPTGRCLGIMISVVPREFKRDFAPVAKRSEVGVEETRFPRAGQTGAEGLL